MNSKGLSLVEVSIGLLIVTIASVVILRFSKSNVSMYRDSYNTETAGITAENKMTELAAIPFPVNGNDSLVIDHTKYKRSWTIKPSGTATRATVVVSWISGGVSMSKTFYGAVK